MQDPAERLRLPLGHPPQAALEHRRETSERALPPHRAARRAIAVYGSAAVAAKTTAKSGGKPGGKSAARAPTKTKLTFYSPPKQVFECRDCPARCCRMPWSIRFGPEEIERYLAEPWVKSRAGEDALAVIARGVLPVREHDRGVQCVFLDDDQLCGMQKKFGHGYIPRPCQTFPFGFVRDEKDVIVAQLSHLCPSIRDGYGTPVEDQLEAKLDQKGAPERMSTAMSTLAGAMLARSHYLAVAAFWDAEIGSSTTSPAETIARLYDATASFEEVLAGGPEKPADHTVEGALKRAREHEGVPLTRRKRPSWHARVLFAYLLGNLCYPSRVRVPNRVGKAPLLEGARAWGNKARWMLDRGRVDMLFVDKPFRLGRVRRVERPVDGPEGELVRDYLRLVLARRQIFSRPRHLMTALLDLGLATTIIGRFARCRAAAAGRPRPSLADVREAIGVAELLLLSHASLSEQGRVMQNLRWLLVTNREAFRGVLGSEA